MKRFSRWMHVVLPPRWVVVLWIVFYLLLVSLPPLFALKYGLIETDWNDHEYQRVIKIILGLFAVIYAVYRVLFFHPSFNASYLEWLTRTPWSYGRPLPNGPLALVPQDAIIVSIMSLTHYYASPETWLLTPAVFLIAHSLAISFSLLFTRQFTQVFLTALLLSGFLHAYQKPILIGALIMTLSLVAHWGISWTLRSFHHWTLEKAASNPFLQLSSQKAQEINRGRLLGWPYDRTGPLRPSTNLSLSWSAAIALLCGWWVFSLLCVLPLEVKEVHGQLLLFLWVLSWFSVARCMSGYASPITFWGRLRTGQWIIPGYDRIFLSPILVSTILFLSGQFEALVPGFFAINIGLTTTVSTFACFLLAPDLNQWRLTGNHRIVAGAGFGQQQELQQTQ